MTDEQLFLLSEVAVKTRLSERSLADAARANKMPHHRIHGRRYMTQAQIDTYLLSTLAGPTERPKLSNDELKEKFLRASTRAAARTRSKG